MEALVEEVGKLTAEEAQLRAELREARKRREGAEATLAARVAERDEGKRREAALRAEEEGLVAESAAIEEELGQLRKSCAAQRIARAWYVSRTPATSFAGAVVRASPVRWASVVSSRQAATTLGSALARDDGARLLLLEQLWGILGNVAAILAGTAAMPGPDTIRAAVESIGYPDPTEEELEKVEKKLKKDLERLREEDEQLQARHAKLTHAALSSGRGSLDSSSPSRMVLRSPSASIMGTPRKTPDSAARALGQALSVSRVANRLNTSGRSSRGGGSVRASAATVYASIVPALNQLKARGYGSIPHRLGGAKALAQAALDPQTREAIVRADGVRLLRDAIAEEQEGEGAPGSVADVASAVSLLRLEVDIALARLGQAREG